MLNDTKIDPTIFFGGMAMDYILGWILTIYLFDCPQNGSFFLTVRPERFHYLPSTSFTKLNCFSDSLVVSQR